MTGRLLERSETATRWRDFAEAIGLEQLRASYGAAWPRSPVAGEHVFIFESRLEPFGWLSLRPDPVDAWVWYAVGVWPAWQKRGVVREIRDFARGWAFTTWPHIAGLAMEVLDTNPAWQLALLRQIERGEAPWRVAGRIEIPGAEAQLFWLPLEQELGRG